MSNKKFVHVRPGQTQSNESNKKKAVDVQLAMAKRNAVSVPIVEEDKEIVSLDDEDGMNTEEMAEAMQSVEEKHVTLDNATTIAEVLEVVQDNRELLEYKLTELGVVYKGSNSIKTLAGKYIAAKTMESL